MNVLQRSIEDRLTMQGIANTLEDGVDGTLHAAQFGARTARKLADETTLIGLDVTRKGLEFGQDVTLGVVKGSLSMIGLQSTDEGG